MTIGRDTSTAKFRKQKQQARSTAMYSSCSKLVHLTFHATTAVSCLAVLIEVWVFGASVFKSELNLNFINSKLNSHYNLQRCNKTTMICMYRCSEARHVYDSVSNSFINKQPCVLSREAAVNVGTFTGCKTSCDGQVGDSASRVMPVCQVSFKPTDVESAVTASNHPPSCSVATGNTPV